MLEASRKNYINLNSEKLQFKVSSVNLFGHTITSKELETPTAKLEAIKNLKTPTNSKDLLTSLGMITFLNRFSAKIADLTAPLRELTKKDIHFHWEKRHQDALDASGRNLQPSSFASSMTLTQLQRLSLSATQFKSVFAPGFNKSTS